ncbi:SDR family oxidoreductase [Alkanindiges illinoisensis]|uniref:SDR family oxidoreductase n=1 Tax=Alkanindiges illinoisensis TaxID=197183 RepID=UPI0009FD02D7|nr:SDR family oxidoreductase [Alkanindiges illinoisensis]
MTTSNPVSSAQSSLISALPNNHLFNSLLLKGKVAIITGASSGIGYATAQLFARQGAAVVLAARRQAELVQLVAEIRAQGGQAVALAGDVGHEAFAQQLVELAIRQFGRLDIAFNNAAILGTMGPVPEMSLQQWNEVMQTNLTSAFLAAKYQLPAILTSGGGSLIFTSTFVGYTAGMPGIAAYAASKAGLIGLTKVLATEYGAQKIRVNALLPGGTDTPTGREFASTPDALEFIASLHALKRMANPAEIAQSALYLASDLSSFTTGTALLVDGGISINHV